jgi:hypothetical protein
MLFGYSISTLKKVNAFLQNGFDLNAEKLDLPLDVGVELLKQSFTTVHLHGFVQISDKRTLKKLLRGALPCTQKRADYG